jgi:hypothetical protein
MDDYDGSWVCLMRLTTSILQITANVSIIYVLQNQQTHFSFTKELSEGTANWMIL